MKISMSHIVRAIKNADTYSRSTLHGTTGMHFKYYTLVVIKHWDGKRQSGITIRWHFKEKKR
jgi:hypothetical protein